MINWKGFKNTKRTRYTLTVLLALFLCLVCVYSLATKQADVANKSIDALMVLVPIYILGDTFRRSNSDMKPFVVNNSNDD